MQLRSKRVTLVLGHCQPIASTHKFGFHRGILLLNLGDIHQIVKVLFLSAVNYPVSVKTFPTSLRKLLFIAAFQHILYVVRLLIQLVPEITVDQQSLLPADFQTPQCKHSRLKQPMMASSYLFDYYYTASKLSQRTRTSYLFCILPAERDDE